MSDSLRDAVFRGARPEASARLFFDWSRRNQGADYRRAAANPTRTHEFFQIFFEARIGIAHAFGILNNRFAIGEKSGNRERHRDTMISKAGEFRAPQWSGPVNLEAVVQFN